VAVNQGSGDVYLVDTRNARVERWSASGSFVSAWGWGVGDGSPAFEVCETTCQAGLTGGGTGELGEFAGGIAVDNSLGLSHGDVYVADIRNNRIAQFAADGTPIAVFGGEVNETKDNALGATAAEKNVCAVSSGDVCKAGVAGHGHGEFESIGRDAVAVDSTGTLYVGDLERVQKLDAAGGFEGEVTMPAGSGSVETLAVDSNKNLYASLSGAEVTGAHEFEACSGICEGKEVGSPRDAGAGFDVQLSVGSVNELFVDDTEAQRILEFAPGGEQTLSLDEPNALGGIAFAEEAGGLYVAHQSFVQFRPLPPPGPVVVEGSEAADEVEPTTTTLQAVVNPEGPEATSYHFEYGTTTAYGSSTGEQPLSGGPFEDQSANAALVGLQPNTTYHFRVVVTNTASQTTFGSDATFTTLPAVGIESESVSQVTATSARLATTLNPHGVATEFHFEYGETTAYGTTVPIPDADAGSGTRPASFAELIEGLSPGTTYHYRVVANNSLGTVQGPDRQFTTQSPQARSLLDGRAWEQVSPIEKHGVSLEAITDEGGVIQAAEGGDAMAYVAKAPITEETQGNRSIADSQMLARRGAHGWSTQDITTPHEEVSGLNIGSLSEYQVFSPDLSLALVAPFGATRLSPQATERTPYRREADGSFTALVYPGDVPPGVKFGGEEVTPGAFSGGAVFSGASSTLAHVILAAPVALVEGLATEGHNSLFEWNDGTIELVSILPNRVPAAEEGMSAALGRNGRQVRNAVSTDGSRVFFLAGEHLYLRDTTLHETVQVDAPVPGAKGGSGEPVFQLATPDGSNLFFTDTSRLTRGATATEDAPDLYMCAVAVVGKSPTCTLSDLTVALHPGEPADVQGAVIGSDETGRYVYFEANGALAAGATPGDCTLGNPTQQPPGALCNLYVADTVEKTVKLVAVVSGLDSPDWGIEGGGGNLGNLTARVSENGEWFAFMSDRPLAGFDNTDARTGAADQEVFLYKRSTGSLTCVSCSASGARPVGVFHDGEPPGLLVDRPRLWQGQTLAGSIPGWTKVQVGRAYYQSRYLSNDGGLFFNSPVNLVSSDANGGMDVYEYEPDGLGGCGIGSGCVGLMSSGESGEETAFLDASTDGNDVFFLTGARLVGSDADSALDVYDAHVCSTSAPCPSGTVSLPPACESVDQCRPAPPPVAAQLPASASPAGPGNFPAVAVHHTTRPLTRAQKLKKALAVCKHKPKRKRAACVKAAKKRFGAVPRRHKQSSSKRKTSGRGK
jgi:hypothetical protein